MPKYTEEQIQKAKDIDVRTFLEQTEGYTFKQSGRYLKCENPEHTGQPSSLAIDTRMNRIFYNSVTGNRPLSAVDWCTIVNKMDFQSAMRLVLGENPQGERVAAPNFEPHRPVKNEEEKKEFHIPEKSPTISRLYAYLTKSRGISSHIVNDCINRGIVFQDQRNNAVFAGFDDDGNMKYAARRGTLTIEGVEPFKRDVAGSDKNFAFKMVGNNTDTIYVTEAAIDAMSLAALEDKFNGIGAYKNKTYISTGGAGMDKAIEQFCKTHDVKTINVCFDNDEAGKNGMEKIMDKFRSLGYEVNDMRASLAHDYNDELIASNSNPDFYPEPPVTTKRIQNTAYERNGAEMESNSSQIENGTEPEKQSEQIATVDFRQLLDMYIKECDDETKFEEVSSEKKENMINRYWHEDWSNENVDPSKWRDRNSLTSQYVGTLEEFVIFGLDVLGEDFANAVKAEKENANTSFEDITLPYWSNDSPHTVREGYTKVPINESEKAEQIRNVWNNYIADKINEHEFDSHANAEVSENTNEQANISNEQSNDEIQQETNQSIDETNLSDDELDDLYYNSVDFIDKNIGGNEFAYGYEPDEVTYKSNLSAQKQTEHIQEQVIPQDIQEKVPYEPSFEEMAELWGEPMQNNYYDIETESYDPPIVEYTQSSESERNDYIMQNDDNIPPMMSSNEHYKPTAEEMAEVFGNPVSNNTQPITEAQTQSNNERNDVTMPNSMSPEQKPVEKQDQATPKQNNQQEHSSQNQMSATVVGNTPYKSIPDKVHMRVDHSLTMNLANRLQEENISYSGRMDKNELVFAVSNKDKDRVSDIIKQEQEALRKKEEPEIPVQPIEPKSSQPEKPKVQAAEVTQSSEPTAVKQDTPELTAEILKDKSPCERANSLLSSLREHHEKRKSGLQDKIEKSNLKILTRTDRIDKLNNKTKNLESTIKSLNAFTAVVKPDSVLGKLANNIVADKERKLQIINDVKIPKHKDKIAHQKGKIAKAQIKLAKVERKIDKIDKVQNFLSSITSKDRDIRHKGFITGMENLTEVRAENLVSKMEKTSAKMEKLNAEYNQPDKSHRERYEIKQKYNDLSAKFKNMENKFEQYKGVSEKLKNMNDSQIDSSLEKTIAKLNERIEKMESNEKGLINTIVEHSVEAGTEAINEVTQDKSLDRVNPEITHERVPDERMPVTEAKEQQILNVIAVATGIDISEMNRLPDEIKADIITEFQENSGNISSEKLTERICEIADIKLPENIKQPETIPEQDKKEEKENPLHHIEEIMEENPNYTNDGLLNNLPTEKENTRKNEKELSSDEQLKHDEKVKAKTHSKNKPLFSIEKIKEAFKPTSSKSQEDIQRDKEQNKNKGISI